MYAILFFGQKIVYLAVSFPQHMLCVILQSACYERRVSRSMFFWDFDRKFCHEIAMFQRKLEIGFAQLIATMPAPQLNAWEFTDKRTVDILN